MKKYYYYTFFIALIFFFSTSFVERTYAQETVESVNKEIADIQKEKLRVLQEIRDKEQKELDKLKAERDKIISPVTTQPVLPTQPATTTQPTTQPAATTQPASTTPTASTTSSDKTDVGGTFGDAKCKDIPDDDLFKYSIYRQSLCSLIRNTKPAGNVTGPIAIEFSDSDADLVRVIVSTIVKDEDSKIRDFLLKTEKVRTDKQIGSDAKNNGTTSIVSKGGIPAFFAFAVENGAAVSSIDGTTMTFRINPAGLLQTVRGAGFADLFEERRKSPLLDILGKTSLGFSFDTTRSVTTPTFTGKENQLSAFSFRYEFINERSPRSKKYQGVWQNFVKTSGQKYLESQITLFERIFGDSDNGDTEFLLPELQTWLNNLNARLKTDSDLIHKLINEGKDTEATTRIEDIIASELPNLPVAKIKQHPSFAALNASIELDQEYLNARQAAIDKIADGQVATFEYINFREPVKPDTHSLRFIWEKGFWKGMDFTVNASMTFYNKKPANPAVKRLRDFDVSGQFDIPMRRFDLGVLNDSVLSFAGKYQRLNTDVIQENGTIAPGTKGDIAVGQFKFTVPIGDTGIKIPISFTFANRTELIKEKEVRGNFGITFDFDSILARLKAFTPILFR